MTESPPKVIMIPAKPELVEKTLRKRQLRVAAYCRVSTDDEEQITSYEAQQHYYTDKIMTNPEWTMAGLFADRGLTGTSARKRPEFLRMIRHCKQKKIEILSSDLIQSHDCFESEPPMNPLLNPPSPYFLLQCVKFQRGKKTAPA